MSGSLEDKQQKMGDHVENIKFSWISKLNFMFSTYSPVFCCLSIRGLEVSSSFSSFLGLIWGFFTFLVILAYCAAQRYPVPIIFIPTISRSDSFVAGKKWLLLYNLKDTIFSGHFMYSECTGCPIFNTALHWHFLTFFQSLRCTLHTLT